MNSYTHTSYNLLQVISSSHILLVVDLWVSNLLDHCTFILKLVLGCDSKFSVGCIPNLTYGFSPPSGLCKFVVRLPFLVITPVTINTLVGFKGIPYGGGPLGIPPEGDGKDGESEVVQYLEQNGGGDFSQGSGNPDTCDIHRQAENKSGGVGGVENYLCGF